MIRPRWYSSRRSLAALIALVTALMSIPLWATAASADTPFPPVTGAFQASVQTPVGGPTYNYAQSGTAPNTHGPTISAVTDGQTMTVTVNGAVPPNATQSTFSRVRVRECKAGASVNNIADFDPFTTNKCTSVGLGTGQAFVDSGAIAPGTTSKSVSFKAGVGHAPDTISGFDGSTLPGFDCNSTHPCQLVAQVQVSTAPGSQNFLSFPIQFAPGPLASLQVTPTGSTNAAGGTQTFHAEGFDAYGFDLGDVTASSTFGIGPDGACVANACGANIAGAHTVTATSGAVTGSTALGVVAGSVASLTLSPPASSIGAGGSQTYTAEGFDTFGNDAGDVTAATTFSIGPNGSCTGNTCAAAVAGAHTVTGTDGSATGTASLTVTAQTVASLVLSPASGSIAAGGSQAYTAEGFDSFSNDLGDYTAATTFTIGPDGSCTGNSCTASVAGAHTVTGTSGSATGTASLTVTGGPVASLVLSPASASIAAGGSQVYTAEGFDAYSNDLGNLTAATTFSIGPNGSCTGNSCTATVAGAHTVTGTDGAATGTASLGVTAGPVASLTLSPASATVGAGQAQAYTAQGVDAYGNSLGNVTASTTFSISPDGSCTAASCTPAAPGAHTVTGTDGAATGTASLTVKKVPTITWATPTAITYPTPLASSKLNAKATDGVHTLPGTFSYSPVSGTVLPAGTNTLSVTFTPTDTANWVSATKTVSLVVKQAVTKVTWATPTAIQLGTPLSATQLNATGTVPGTVTYTKNIGDVLPLGTTKVTATLTPSDPSYLPSTKIVSIKVVKDNTTTVLGLTSPLSFGHEDTAAFTADVTAAVGPIPSGKVTIKAGTTTLCTATLDAAGHASCVTKATKLPVGTYQVTAFYAGGTTANKSNSAAATLVINP